MSSFSLCPLSSRRWRHWYTAPVWSDCVPFHSTDAFHATRLLSHAAATWTGRIQIWSRPPRHTQIQQTLTSRSQSRTQIPRPLKRAPKYTLQQPSSTSATSLTHKPNSRVYLRPRTVDEGISSLMLHSCKTTPSAPPTWRRVMSSSDRERLRKRAEKQLQCWFQQIPQDVVWKDAGHFGVFSEFVFKIWAD